MTRLGMVPKLFLSVVLTLSCNVSNEASVASRSSEHQKPTSTSSSDSVHAVLTGTVMHRSDVVGEPDEPYSTGVVLIVPAQSRDSLLSRSGKQQLELIYQMTDELYADFVTSSAVIDQRGRYTLQLTPGSYIVFLGNIGQSRPDPRDPPVVIYGHFITHLQPGKQHLVDMFFGEGGLAVQGDIETE